MSKWNKKKAPEVVFPLEVENVYQGLHWVALHSEKEGKCNYLKTISSSMSRVNLLSDNPLYDHAKEVANDQVLDVIKKGNSNLTFLTDATFSKGIYRASDALTVAGFEESEFTTAKTTTKFFKPTLEQQDISRMLCVLEEVDSIPTALINKISMLKAFTPEELQSLKTGDQVAQARYKELNLTVEEVVDLSKYFFDTICSVGGAFVIGQGAIFRLNNARARLRLKDMSRRAVKEEEKGEAKRIWLDGMSEVARTADGRVRGSQIAVDAELKLMLDNFDSVEEKRRWEAVIAAQSKPSNAAGRKASKHQD